MMHDGLAALSCIEPEAIWWLPVRNRSDLTQESARRTLFRQNNDIQASNVTRTDLHKVFSYQPATTIFHFM